MPRRTGKPTAASCPKFRTSRSADGRPGKVSLAFRGGNEYDCGPEPTRKAAMQLNLPDFSSVESLVLSCNAPGAWRFATERAAAPDGAEILRVRLSAPEAAQPPAFDVA